MTPYDEAEAACNEAKRLLENLTDDQRRRIAPLVYVDLLRTVAPELVAVPIAEHDRLLEIARNRG